MQTNDEKITNFKRLRRAYAQTAADHVGVLSAVAWEALEMLCTPSPEAVVMIEIEVLAELHGHGFAGCISEEDERVVPTYDGRQARLACHGALMRAFLKARTQAAQRS